MRSGVEKDEFKYDYDGHIKCELDEEECCCEDCMCCERYNKFASDIHTMEKNAMIPFNGEVCSMNDVNYTRNIDCTIAKFDSVDDAITAFSLCTFFDINYSPNEMYRLYPLFFKLKAYFSMGVPIRLLGNGEDSPLIAEFRDGSVYAIAVRRDDARWQRNDKKD